MQQTKIQHVPVNINPYGDNYVQKLCIPETELNPFDAGIIDRSYCNGLFVPLFGC